MREFFSSILYPTLLTIFGPCLAMAGSRYATGDWLKWFGYIPIWAYVFFFGLCITWMVSCLVSARNERIRSIDREVEARTAIPEREGWIPLDSPEEYDGVLWTAAAPPLLEGTSDRLGLGFDWRRIEVNPLPLCPKCKTEVDETRDILGFCVWRCPDPDCNWHRRRVRDGKTTANGAAKVHRNLYFPLEEILVKAEQQERLDGKRGA